MRGHHGIWQTAAVQAALDSGDLGAIVRALRHANHLTLAQLGGRCGYSTSTLSRMERGKQPLRDVRVLRSIADALRIPARLLGLANTPSQSVAPSRSAPGSGLRVGRVTSPTVKEDPVQRRRFLLAAGATVAGGLPAFAPSADVVDPARLLTQRLGDALLTPVSRSTPAPLPLLRQGAALARREFTACDYIHLTTRLPTLLAAAEATAALHPEPGVHQVLATTYNVITNALIKLEESGLEWLSADRGLHAARLAEDALTMARSQRLVAAVARRAGHHARAQDLTLGAAHYLDISCAQPDPEHLVMHGILHCTASYAAAQAGDRDRTNDLLAEATAAADRLAEGSTGHRTLLANLISYRISDAHALGDAGTALAHARSLPLAVIPTTERRARVLVDTARCWAQLDRPDQAFRTLLAAERTAPGEVRTRTAVRSLVADLLASPRQATMPGLLALASRVHAFG